MPEIAPFAAIRFDHTRTGGDISHLIAPPYDVLDRDDKDALLLRSDHNIVAIDLPHIPPKSLGPASAYEQAAATMNAWRADGTLVTEDAPALYIYHQRFEHEGKTYTRRKFFARVRLHRFEDGVILPHEKTFGGPKEDRLALMNATKCQLSPVFALYTDPKDAVGSAFAGTIERDPDIHGDLEGVHNAMWIVTDTTVIERVASVMADKKLYIADGHHRYGTALNYRDGVAAEHGSPLPADHPANYIMLVLASMDDPGCLILPYHRALAGVELQAVLDAWSPGTEPADPTTADIVLFDGKSGAEHPLRFSDRAKLLALEPDECAPWYDLDYAYLHRYLIDELLRTKLGTDPKVRYAKSAEDAKDVAKSEAGVALLVKPTPLEHLRAVSDAGGLMPQKSTYFFPKLATGLTINPLE